MEGSLEGCLPCRLHTCLLFPRIVEITSFSSLFRRTLGSLTAGADMDSSPVEYVGHYVAVKWLAVAIFRNVMMSHDNYYAPASGDGHSSVLTLLCKHA